jgi:hypothetical protein
MDDNLYVNIEDCVVSLSFIKKEYFEKISHFLMKVLLFNNDLFVSYTVSDDEISIFLDERLLENLTDNMKDLMHIDDKRYKVIQIYEFSSGISHIGIVHKISCILSKKEIPILYINTYNNNFVLVEKENLDRVTTLLKNDGFKFN